MQICSIMNSLIQNVQNTETFSTFHKSADAVNLFLGEFSTKTKSTSVFGGSVASLFFLMVKVLSKEVSATISNFYMKIFKKNPYLISQQIVYDHINPNEIFQKL